MATKITKGVLESHLKCPYKAYLKLAGEQGPQSDYEAMLERAIQALRIKASARVIARFSDGEILRGATLTHGVLARGEALILDSRIEDDTISLLFDGLKKDRGVSHLGDFYYAPLFYYEGGKIRLEQKLLLALYGLMLARIQGRRPESGMIVRGGECRLTTVHLTRDVVKRAQLSMEEIAGAHASGLAPKLVLNEHCRICEFRQRCQAQAEKDDDVSLLRCLSRKEVNRYNRKGIFTLTQLSCTFHPRRRAKRAKKANYAHYAALQALAIREKKIYVYGTPSLPDKPVRVFLDVEGNPERSFVYLIGMIIQEQSVEKSYSFWIDKADQEEQLFHDFTAVLAQYEDFCLFHYGAYERTFLRRVSAHVTQKRFADKLTRNAVNVLSVVHAHIYFPTFSNSLKDIGSYLGSTWTEEQATGIQALVWRRRWEETAEEVWKNGLLRYNLEDCAALKTTTECIYGIIEADKHRDENGASPKTQLPFAWAEDCHCPSTRRQWGKPSFELPEFQYINKCAYFDYQREKVLLRTSKTIRKACTRQRRRRGKKLTPNLKIQIRARKCPHCRGTDIVRQPGPIHVKVAYDLQFSRGCIRRRVIHCTAVPHYCNSCTKSFLPKRYKRRDKHFHGLKSWAVYQYVVHRISLQNLEAMFEECFGLRVGLTELHMIKSLMARRYRHTWRQILHRIVSGNVIHIDETLANLQKGKGYVWVLTNLSSYEYISQPCRLSRWCCRGKGEVRM